jgi:hypothetical protein
MRPRFTLDPLARPLVLAVALLAALGACGEDRDQLATARCKAALRQALGSQAKLAFPGPREAALRDDAVYGWHLDLDVEAKLGSGETRRSGYRCLFVVENRDTPLFLAVVER